MRLLTVLTTLTLLSACSSPAVNSVNMMSAAPLRSQSAASTSQARVVLTRAVTTISPQEASQWLADPHSSWKIIDLRTPQEVAGGIIKGATLMNFNAPGFREQLLNLDRNQPFIIYCASGKRSVKALEMMRELGFRNAYDIQGGTMAWQAAGLPLVKAGR